MTTLYINTKSKTIHQFYLYKKPENDSENHFISESQIFSCDIMS